MLWCRIAVRGANGPLRIDLMRPDGRSLHVLLNAAAARGPAGEFLHARCTFLDLTGRLRSEQRLAEVASQLQAVLAAATEFAILATDLEDVPHAFAADRYGARWEPGKHAPISGTEGSSPAPTA